MNLRLVSLLLFFSAWSAPVEASIGDRFGFTSEDSALAGARAGVAERSSSSAFTNPAQLSLAPESGNRTPSPIRLHWSAFYSEPSFTDIRGVVVENPVNSDLTTGNSEVRNVDTDYPATFGQSIGIAVRSTKSNHHWGFGAVAYLPLDRFALLDSGEPFVPEYTLHRGRTQKPEFQFAFSGLITPDLSFGGGLYLGTRLTADTTIFLNQGSGTSSTMRIAASLKTQATPYFGLVGKFSNDLSAGLVVRFASSSPESLRVQASARAVGSVAAPDFSFPALATMYYDPFTVSAGTRWRYASTRTAFLQVDYQAWSRFESPVLVIQNQACDPNCGVDFEPGRNLSGKTRDIVVPRVGHAWIIGTHELYTGYSYRPGIYRELPEGAGNAIDPDEHRLSVGLGWNIDSLPIFDAPGRVDLHSAYSIYPKETVVKSPGDENGNLSNRKVGAPGYETGGHEFGGGLTVQLFL
jgi:hypothetical protein